MSLFVLMWTFVYVPIVCFVILLGIIKLTEGFVTLGWFARVFILSNIPLFNLIFTLWMMGSFVLEFDDVSPCMKKKVF